MVKAGPATDAMIDALAGLLDPGDIVVDGGNAHYLDTHRREAALRKQGIHLLGIGVSGGEEGAFHGPSIMPGGDREAYARSRRPGGDRRKGRGQPCSAYVGPEARATS